jgi:hypothetical protein
MRGVFEPLGWVVNRIITDYGVDFDVQLFEGSVPTGEWFKVQLKSSESTDYSTHGGFISEALSIPTRCSLHKRDDGPHLSCSRRRQVQAHVLVCSAAQHSDSKR